MEQNEQDIYTVIVEWNSVLVNLLWILSMVMEWREMRLVLGLRE